MYKGISENFVAKILSIGAAITTIVIVSGSVTDPVNTPKFVAIGVVGFASIGAVLASGGFAYLRGYKMSLIGAGLFLTAMLLSVFTSDSPLSQNVYGSYGRNNGLLTYVFLLSIFLSSLCLRAVRNFELVIKALIFGGLINVIYCLWVIVFGDFIGWSNPYGNILGTFGNPNFIGSFLGIFFTAYVGYSLRKSSSKYLKLSLILVLPITALEIYKSHAIQGRVVTAFGLGVLGFLVARARFGKLIGRGYIFISVIVGTFALLGALQIGPLAAFIYKTSVSLRGQYWLAGWNTGSSHPITGVGMDSFGDWYRRSRDIHALELPGPNVVVNAAHNVPLDMFAFGGWPLLLSYLIIIGVAGLAATRLVLRRISFDPILAILLTAWAGYQLQSIISINQIGLAVWGWLLSGLLIAYERATRDENPAMNPTATKISSSKRDLEVQPRIILVSVAGSMIGLLMALPPLTADAKWRSAQLHQSLQELEASMSPSYFNPQNSTKYLANIQALEGSNLFDLSHKYALEAISWNPEAFELWKVIYLIKNSTLEEKALALKNMNRLDPLNPDVISTQ